jgi:hypothetical protein
MTHIELLGGDALLDSKLFAAQTCLRLPDGLPIESWRQMGEQIQAVTDLSAWWIGDWLVYGQKHYAGRYRRAMEGTSLHYQTLRNYAWVARKFDPDRRRKELTFHHHMEVAALTQEEQDHWLDFAARLNWTRDELRRQIRASISPARDHPDTASVQLNLQLDEIRLQRWRAAAKKSNQDLKDWITSIVDSAL